MLEIQTRQRCVIDLDVNLDLLRQPITLQESEHGGHIVIVLVFGRLERLRLDENRAFEADAVFVIHHHGEKPAVLIELAAADPYSTASHTLHGRPTARSSHRRADA